MKKTPMTPRQVAEDIDGSDDLTRVLAAAIDAADHPELGTHFSSQSWHNHPNSGGRVRRSGCVVS